MSNLQLNKLKSEIKNGAEVILEISSHVVDDFNDENNFLRKFLLTDARIPKLRKAFANVSSANIKLSKAQLHNIGQSRGFLSGILGLLIKSGWP